MPSTGIYKIENKLNGRIYIGQSVNIENRWREHKRGKQSPNMVISRAIKKHGSNSFMFDIIEICSKEELNMKEIYWISFYNSYKIGYNSTTGGDSPTDSKSNKLTNENVNQIKKELINNVVMIKDIAKIYKVADTTITSINTGQSWYDSNLNYPLRIGNSVYLAKFSTGKKVKTKDKKEKVKKLHKCPCCNVILKYSASKTCKNCKYTNQHKCIHPSKIALIAGILNSSQVAIGLKHGVSGNTVKKWCKKYNIPVTRKGFKFNWIINIGVGKGSRILISKF